MQSVKTTLTISNILTKTSGPKQFWLCAQWYIQCTTVHAFRIKFYTLVFNLKCAEYSSIQKKLNKTANTFNKYKLLLYETSRESIILNMLFLSCFWKDFNIILWQDSVIIQKTCILIHQQSCHFIRNPQSTSFNFQNKTKS